MKSGNKERTGTLRMLLAAMETERTREGKEVDEETFLTVVQRSVKQRREAAEQYRNGDRPELADKEDAEAEILAEYLPEPVSEDEVRNAIADFVAAEGLEGPQAIGRIMGTILPRYKGRIDGREMQRIAREVLG
jgi:hypothetical protein